MSKAALFGHWLLLTFLCVRKGSCVQGVRDLETKVALLRSVEPQDPKCFAAGKYDLTCFWEERGAPENYTFTYKYEEEKSVECTVTAKPVGGGKTRYVCKPSTVMHFLPLDLHVFRAGQQIHNRSIFVDRVFLLDPPANLTMMLTGRPGQARLRWVPPPPKYMDDSMTYEVSYFSSGSPMGKREMVQANTEITLRGLQPGTKYVARVRVKFDGVTYDGYWSAWTPEVSMETPHTDTDPLVLSLCLVIFFILTLLSLSVLLSRRRFLLKKMWPLIPSPDSNFPGLFTVYEGDFQAWLVHSSGGVGWIPASYFLEELPGSLEVLSEVILAPAAPHRTAPPRVPPAPGAEGEEEEEAARKADAGLPDAWKRPLPRHPHPPFECVPLECKDAYVTLNQSGGRAPDPPDDVSEESLPPRSLSGAPGSRSDLGSLRRSSGSGRLSARSSLEEDSRHAWQPKSPSYAYLTVADSGICLDYGPMSRTGAAGTAAGVYANAYENDGHPHGLPVHSEC